MMILEEDEENPRFREQEGETFQRTGRERSRSIAPRRTQSVGAKPREDGTKTKDGLKTKERGPVKEGQEESHKQDSEPTKAAASRSGVRRSREPRDKTPQRLEPPEKNHKSSGSSRESKRLLSAPATPSGKASRVPGTPSASHGSSTPLQQHEPFRSAQARAEDWEKSSRTLHDLLKSGQAFSVEEGQATESILQIEVPMPQKQSELKKFMTDSSTWLSGKLKKGVELRWRDIPQERIADFQQAKAKEVSNWVKQSALRLVKHDVPKDRLIRMRWLYTLKHDDTAKARLILIGYEDPDLTELDRSSPTMTRRSRGLFFTMAAQQQWTTLKADVRAAFLQGDESETGS